MCRRLSHRTVDASFQERLRRVDDERERVACEFTTFCTDTRKVAQKVIRGTEQKVSNDRVAEEKVSIGIVIKILRVTEKVEEVMKEIEILKQL